MQHISILTYTLPLHRRMFRRSCGEQFHVEYGWGGALALERRTLTKQNYTVITKALQGPKIHLLDTTQMLPRRLPPTS